jgi:hypothetical protein
MEGDTLTVSDSTTEWIRVIPRDSTQPFSLQEHSSLDSTLYFGSGFWFKDVVQYLRQRDSFGMSRHDADFRPNKYASESLMLGLLLFDVILISFMLQRGLKLIGQYTRLGFGIAEQTTIQGETPAQSGYNNFLWALTLIVFSLMAHVLLNLRPEHSVLKLDSLDILKLFVFTFAYFIVQNAVCELVGRLYFKTILVNKWVSHNKATLFLYAMTLTPVLIGAEMGMITDSKFLFLWSVAFLIIAKLWLFINTLRIFSAGGVGFLYFILYLCALEILPILLFYKGLFLL